MHVSNNISKMIGKPFLRSRYIIFVLYIFIPVNLVFGVFVVLVGLSWYVDSQFGFILAR